MRDKEEKLLFMGASIGTEEAVSYAREQGVYTILTAQNAPENGEEKFGADEYWNIDLADLVSLEKKCRKEKVTGIFAATSEFCLDMSGELCKRVGLPFYASDAGWAASRDKRFFKQCCKECGLTVPKEYPLDKLVSGEASSSISYPIVVKPADSCARQGVSVCKNRDELLAGYQKAMQASPGKKCLAEEFVKGMETTFFYYLQDGKAVFIGCEDTKYIDVGGNHTSGILLYPGRETESFLKKDHHKIETLFRKLSCKWGVAFLQAILKDGEYYFLEMGYRLDAVYSWSILASLTGFHSVRYMVDLARGKVGTSSSLKERTAILMSKKEIGVMYLIWAKAGRVDKVIGLETVRSMPGVSVLLERYGEGDFIENSASMRQIAYQISILSGDMKEIAEKIKLINNVLQMYDENGENLLLPFQAFEELEFEKEED